MPRNTQQGHKSVKSVSVSVAAASPKKKNMGKVIVLGGDRFWERIFEGKQLIVRCCDNLAFDATTGTGMGTWDDEMATLNDE
jgi:hypothetical protein